MPRTHISDQPVMHQDNIYGLQPDKWFGPVAADGTKSPWKDVAVGSEYTGIVAGTATFYFKKVSTSSAGDWKAVTMPADDPEEDSQSRRRKEEEEKEAKPAGKR